MATNADTYNERQPDDFQRHPHTGAPYVNHPTETTKNGRPRRVQYGRPSSFGKRIEDATNLQKWAERAVALGAYLDYNLPATDPGLFDELDALPAVHHHLDDDQARPILDTIAHAAKDAAQANLAAERGTFTHELTEIFDEHGHWLQRLRAGDALDIPAAAGAALVAAWDQLLDRYGLEIDVVEQTVVDDAWQLAGTLDRIATTTKRIELGDYSIEPNTTVVLDIKTGQLRTHRDGHPQYWHGYAVQIASYAQSVPYDVETDQRGEWERYIHQGMALIAHLDVRAALDEGEARARLIAVDLQRGRYAGDLCAAAKTWQNSRDVFSSALGECITVPVGESALDPTPPVTDDGDYVTVVDREVDRRQELRTRYERMRANASDTGWRDTFDRQFAAAQIDATSTCDEIQAALDAIEPPFDPEPSPSLIGRPQAHVEVEPQIDDGGPLDDTTRAHLVRVIAGSPKGVRDTVNLWLAQSVSAGVSFDPRFEPTVRRFEITRAALKLATATSGDEQDDTCARMIIGLATGAAVRSIDFHGSAGAHLGSLTIDEAKRVSDLADAFGDTLTLIYREDGTPDIKGDVAAILAAAD